ncbi:MAG: amino acid adenylation domain-containing protein, partial [bacterium]|nr:amino acid adenylation domain-containing protein [bacterium]
MQNKQTITQTQLDQVVQRFGNNISDIYPLSPMQQGMLFHSLYEPGSGVYFEQIHCGLKGQPDIDAFHQAWQYLIDRHTILRTAFWHETNTPLQVVCKTVELPRQSPDWRDYSQEEQRGRLERLLKDERGRGFDLGKAPLMRLQLIRETDIQSRLVWHFHHILLDGWSLPILLGEWFEAYSALAAGGTLDFPPGRPYRAYISWLGHQDREKAKSYWLEQLQGFSAPTPLPVLAAQKHDKTPGFMEVTLTLEGQAGQQLKDFCRQHRLTINTLVQGAWAALLSRYSGETDIVFGVTTSGREIPVTGIDKMVGLFINTLPLRVKMGNNDILSRLKTIQRQLQQNNQYAYTPLTDIQNCSDVPNGVSMFDTIVVFENYPLDETFKEKSPNPLLQPADFETIEYTNYPITLAVIPGREFHFKLTYDGNRFQQESIERMLAHLSRLLEGMTAHPDRAWHRLPMLTQNELRQLQDWNETGTKGMPDRTPALLSAGTPGTIVDLFQAQVEKTPDNIAVSFEDRQLSYRELNRKANQLAHYLLTLDVNAGPVQGPGSTPVGICVRRSLEMAVGILGILKTGGAYLPLDPDSPRSRLQFMLEDSSASVLLSQSHLLEGLSVSTGKVVCLDYDGEAIAEGSGENPAPQCGPGDPAYVIYTSGSTGKPKGVIISHASIHNHINSSIIRYQIESGDKVLQFTSFNFDASLEQILETWCSGARLVLLRTNQLEAKPLINILHKEQITITDFPPAYWRQLLNEADNSSFETLKCLILGGDALASELARQTHGILSKNTTLLNAYGPTEATITASLFEVTETFQATGTDDITPIGQPTVNTRIYILDANQNLTPPGIPGELCIAGPGLAGGYLNPPKLTPYRFIKKDFSHGQTRTNTDKTNTDKRGHVFYKTG